MRVSSDLLAPGEEGTIEIDFEGGTEVQTGLCIATNDPGSPQLLVDLASGGSGAHEMFGTEAPDFALEGLDGETYVLSEQLGHPVLLAYFATW